MRQEILQYSTIPTPQSEIPTRPFAYPKAWTRGTLRKDDFWFRIPDACKRELEDVIESLRRDPLPTLVLRPEMFSLNACRTFMATVKHSLTDGVGCAVLHQLPMARISREEAIAVYWLLGSLIAPPVAQKWNGLMIYDVKDVGAKHGIGVRGSTTNAELIFHTDNSYAMMPPQFIGLLCCQPALAGGKSRLLSWRAVYNALLGRCPDLLPRAFDTFLYDRNNEHGAGAPKIMCKAPFAVSNGDIKVRFSPTGIRDGHEMANEPIDPDGQRLLGSIQDVIADPAMWIELDFEPGQIQLINNNVIGHARTGFKDDPAPDRKRHLIRLWFRDEGGINYDG